MRALARVLGVVTSVSLIIPGAPSASAADSVPLPAPVDSAAAPATSAEDARPDRLSAQLAARLTGRRVEILGERSETTTVWANPDGTLTSAVATSEVRVRDNDGEWRDVDATLSLRPDGVRPAVLPVDVRFSPGGAGELARVGRDGRWLALGWPGPLPVPVVSGTRAVYTGAASGADLVLDVTRHGFEQSLVLATRPAVAPVFSLPVTASPGLTVSLDGRGAIRATDASGQVVVSGSAPVMYDATRDDAGAPARPVPLGVRLQGGRLVITPDPAFLSDPTVRYPVVLDPSAVLGRASDTFVESGGSATTNFNSSTELRIGLRNTASGILTQRAFLTFPTSSLAGKKIVDAELKLWNYSSPNGCVGVSAFVNRVSGGWSPSTVTWNTQPGVDTTSVSSSSQIYGATGCPANWLTFSGSGLVTTVQDWADQTAGSYGLRLHSGESTGTTLGYRRLNSGEATSNTPVLTVTYDSYPSVVAGRATEPCFTCGSPVEVTPRRRRCAAPRRTRTARRCGSTSRC
ncbi:MAG TPA: DNRLRE domain-containing protein [Mycobacteriales bacterium]